MNFWRHKQINGILVKCEFLARRFDNVNFGAKIQNLRKYEFLRQKNNTILPIFSVFFCSKIQTFSAKIDKI